MVKDFVIRTDEQGKFTVEAESVLTPFRQRTWTSVGLSFAHKGYVSFHTNYSIASGSEFASDGVPLVQLGQIALRPTRPPTTK